MKRLTIYTILLLLLGGMALTLAHRAQTQDVPEDTAVPNTTIPHVPDGGASTPEFSYQGQLLDAQGNPVTDSVPMTFRLFPTLTGGTACWTENHTGANEVEVVDGRFSLLLGSITPTNTDCLADDAYLELQINGEILSPRQLITDAIVPNGSQLGKTIVGQDLSFDLVSDRGRIIGPENSALHLISDDTPLNSNGTWYRGSWMALSSIDNSVFPGSVRINIAKDNNLGNSPVLDVIRVQNDGISQELLTVDEYGNLSTTGNVGMNGHNLRMGESGNASDADIVLRYDSGRILHLLPWAGSGYRYDSVCVGCGSSADLIVNGDTFINGWLTSSANSDLVIDPGATTYNTTQFLDDVNISGDLSVGGSCNASVKGDEVAASGGTCTAVRITEDGVQTGAVIELNLMTADERTAGRIDRFTQGDVLCWSTATERLEKCTQANTRLVMAVANAKGLPIVQGAEPVKVLGPVTAGDTLVASATPGYAMVNNDADQGTSIGKALDDFHGEVGLIMVWIRP